MKITRLESGTIKTNGITNESVSKYHLRQIFILVNRSCRKEQEKSQLNKERIN